MLFYKPLLHTNTIYLSLVLTNLSLTIFHRYGLYSYHTQRGTLQYTCSDQSQGYGCYGWILLRSLIEWLKSKPRVNQDVLRCYGDMAIFFCPSNHTRAQLKRSLSYSLAKARLCATYMNLPSIVLLQHRHDPDIASATEFSFCKRQSDLAPFIHCFLLQTLFYTVYRTIFLDL